MHISVFSVHKVSFLWLRILCLAGKVLEKRSMEERDFSLIRYRAHHVTLRKSGVYVLVGVRQVGSEGSSSLCAKFTY